MTGMITGFMMVKRLCGFCFLFCRSEGPRETPAIRASAGAVSPFSFPPARLLFAAAVLLFAPACGDSGAESLLQKANEEWIQGRNHSAIKLLNSVLEKESSGPNAETALFRLGEIYHFSLGDSSRALIYFQEVLQMDPQGSLSYKAQKYIAEIVEFSLKDFDQAILEYQKLINNPAHPEENGDHQYRIASIYYKKQEFQQALAELEVLLEEYPESQWAEESQFKIIEILYTLNRCPEVRDHYGEFIEKFSSGKFRNELEYIVASCMEEEGKLKEALTRFMALEDKYPFPGLLKMKMEGIRKRIRKQR